MDNVCNELLEQSPECQRAHMLQENRPPEKNSPLWEVNHIWPAAYDDAKYQTQVVSGAFSSVQPG